MKIKAFLLAVVMTIQFCTVPGIVFANEREVYLNETFSSIATNDVPYDYTITGSENNRVVMETDSNKVLRLDMTKGMASVGVPVTETSDTLWFGVRYYTSHKMQKGSVFNLIGASGEENASIKLSTGGCSLSYDKPFKSLGNNVWNDVAIMVNYDRGTYDVYVNGVCKISDWMFEKALTPTSMVEFEFGPADGDTSGAFVYVDDIRIWSGDSYLAVTKTQSVSDEEVEFAETEEEFYERYRGLTHALLDNEKIMGFCYTQLYDIEQEQNGLYTYYRAPKVKPERIYEINTNVAAVEK